MTENVIVWTGSGFDEWDYYKVKELGIPDYAREATQEEAALYRQHAAEITRLRAENAGLREALAGWDADMAALGGCGDGGCVVVKPIGMHTNGGCRCMRDQIKSQRFARAANKFAQAARAALNAVEKRDE